MFKPAKTPDFGKPREIDSQLSYLHNRLKLISSMPKLPEASDHLAWNMLIKDRHLDLYPISEILQKYDEIKGDRHTPLSRRIQRYIYEKATSIILDQINPVSEDECFSDCVSRIMEAIERGESIYIDRLRDQFEKTIKTAISTSRQREKRHMRRHKPLTEGVTSEAAHTAFKRFGSTDKRILIQSYLEQEQNPLKHKAIGLLLEGKTEEEAAAAIGRTERTIRNWIVEMNEWIAKALEEDLI